MEANKFFLDDDQNTTKHTAKKRMESSFAYAKKSENIGVIQVSYHFKADLLSRLEENKEVLYLIFCFLLNFILPPYPHIYIPSL